MVTKTPECLLLGQLRREYIIPPSGSPLIDQPGGGLLYAAAGMAVWEEKPGLMARVGEDYPRQWLERFESLGFSAAGVRVLPEAIDLRTFLAYSDTHTYSRDDPVRHFAQRGLSFPRSLLGYKSTQEMGACRDKFSPLTLRPSDLPDAFRYATAAHLCPTDYLTHSLMPAALRREGVNTLTVDPDASYMHPDCWPRFPALLTGLTAFLPSETELRGLFSGRSRDLWEMVETLAGFGCELVVVKRGELGQILYDAASRRRYQVPAYPARAVDPTGAGDAFCGGFLAGYRRSWDPVQAMLYGNVSASLVVEGSGAFSALESLPGLAQARLESLRETVRKL